MIDGLLPSRMINRETFLSLTSLSHLTHLSNFQGNVFILKYIQRTCWKGFQRSISPWCCVAFKYSHKMIRTHISNLSPCIVYTTSVHMAQNLESRSRSDLANSLLKLNPKGPVIMLMRKEKHFKRLLLRNSSCLKSSYLCSGNTVYSLFPFLHSLMIYTLTDPH